MYKTYEDFLGFLTRKNFQKRINSLAIKYKGKKVIIYGTGTIFDVILENFDISGLDIIAISDIKFDKPGEYKGFQSISPTKIPELKPDVVLITMYESFRAEDYFEDALFKEYGKFRYEAMIEIPLWQYIIDLIR